MNTNLTNGMTLHTLTPPKLGSDYNVIPFMHTPAVIAADPIMAEIENRLPKTGTASTYIVPRPLIIRVTCWGKWSTQEVNIW